ncbi:hypothetical protein ACMD2_26974 [Ananas comosus]|uniref:Uncharacterized protein n=1 Tax=Ananas comosus TaxID=4615 RepID=A0A199V7V8_ANACO|nr:hypothetical protein ACMD2_26974 [Ananas comosus]
MLAAAGRLYLNNNRFTGEVPARLVQGLMGGGGLQVLYLQHNFLTGVEIAPAAAAALRPGLALPAVQLHGAARRRAVPAQGRHAEDPARRAMPRVAGLSPRCSLSNYAAFKLRPILKMHSQT